MIYLTGEVTKNSVLEIIEDMQKVKDCILVINSEGGSVYDALMLYDYIRTRKYNVHTIGMGLIASAAVPILACGDTRSITEEAWVMLHEGSTKLGRVTASEMQKQIVQERKLEHQYCRLLARHSKANIEEWATICKEETYLTGKETYQLGLVDQVIKGAL